MRPGSWSRHPRRYATKSGQAFNVKFLGRRFIPPKARTQSMPDSVESATGFQVTTEVARPLQSLGALWAQLLAPATRAWGSRSGPRRRERLSTGSLGPTEKVNLGPDSRKDRSTRALAVAAATEPSGWSTSTASREGRLTVDGCLGASHQQAPSQGRKPSVYSKGTYIVYPLGRVKG